MKVRLVLDKVNNVELEGIEYSIRNISSPGDFGAFPRVPEDIRRQERNPINQIFGEKPEDDRSRSHSFNSLSTRGGAVPRPPETDSYETFQNGELTFKSLLKIVEEAPSRIARMIECRRSDGVLRLIGGGESSLNASTGWGSPPNAANNNNGDFFFVLRLRSLCLFSRRIS